MRRAAPGDGPVTKASANAFLAFFLYGEENVARGKHTAAACRQRPIIAAGATVLFPGAGTARSCLRSPEFSR